MYNTTRLREGGLPISYNFDYLQQYITQQNNQSSSYNITLLSAAPQVPIGAQYLRWVNQEGVAQILYRQRQDA